MLVKCFHCDIEFNKKKGRVLEHVRSFCSRKCYFAQRKKDKIFVNCKVCNKSVYRLPKDIKRSNTGTFVCSMKCMALNQTGKNNHQYKYGGYTPKSCEFCGKEFNTNYTYKRKYCSRDCRSKDSIKRLKLNCSQCGTVIEKVPALVYSTNFCSMPCKNDYHSNRISGKNNGRYDGGQSLEKYPSKWSKKLKDYIRFRDGYKCALCNIPTKKLSRQLDVHHIDRNKLNISYKNLISLCPKCHIGKAHGKDSKCRRLLAVQLKKLAIQNQRTMLK